MKYDIERRTLSTDASESALLGSVYWHDTGETENGEVVYKDNATDTFAYWYDGADWIITAVADVGGTPTNYYSDQLYPNTITVSGSGFPEYDGEYTYSAGAWYNGINKIYYDDSNDKWRLIEDDIVPKLAYYADSLDPVAPPKTGWEAESPIIEPAPTLAYDIPTSTLSGNGAFTGSLTVSEYTIADAWYRAETEAFESLRNFCGCEEESECFRGYLPIAGDKDDYKYVNVWMFSSGESGEFDIDRLSGNDAAWCSLRSDAVVEGLFETRQRAMEFAGLVMAWLKQTDNMKEQGNIEWCVVSDIPGAPTEYITIDGRIRRRYWTINIPLELIYKTENVFG